METTRFGRTGLSVSRTAFGCLPIQRIPAQDAAALLRRAVEGGINFFDTARAYTDSEEKMGLALSGLRDAIVLATKTTGAERRRVLDGFGNQPEDAAHRPYRHLSVPQPRLCSAARRGGRPVRRGVRGAPEGPDSLYRHYAALAGARGRGGGIGAVRYAQYPRTIWPRRARKPWRAGARPGASALSA